MTKEISKSKDKGITLIALIITIIVMLILVGVTVAVAINGGLFDTAKRAASGMQMAQIREKAEVVKATLIAEAQSNNSIIVSKTEYKNRLLQEFAGSTAVGSKVVIEDGKYDIIIKNTNLDIEVVEHSNNAEPGSLVALDYTTNNIEEDGKIYVINTTLNLSKTMEVREYIEIKSKENGEVTEEGKKQVVIEYFSEMYAEQFNSLDDLVVYDINSWYSTEYTTIEECLQDTTVQSEWGTTKEQLYYSWYNWEIPTSGNEMTEQEVIEAYYPEAIENKYRSEFGKYTQNLLIYIEKEGTQELIKDKVNIYGGPVTVNYAIGTNGKYEFVVKTSTGEEITREAMQINNIVATPNPYVLTKEEAQGVWETDGKGTITKYTGENSSVAVPVCIGTEFIDKLGVGTFRNCTNITDVIILYNIIDMGNGTFYGCKNLANITIPNNITYIGNDIFMNCSSLQSINIPQSVTSINAFAFNGCSSLKEIIVPDSVVEIRESAFENCTSLRKIVLPDSITNIYRCAFKNCSKLESVRFSKNIKQILESTFEGCINLTNITLEEGTEWICKAAFRGCTSLTEITIPNSVTNIRSYGSGGWEWEYSTFEGCTNLTTINFAPGDNPIPEGQPWGAPNENLVVTKLTQ